MKCAVLDGELVCLDRCGMARFHHLMFRRAEPVFYAFDLVWLDGEDLRLLPLLERKRRLLSVIAKNREKMIQWDPHSAGSNAAEWGGGLKPHFQRGGRHKRLAHPLCRPYRAKRHRAFRVRVQSGHGRHCREARRFELPYDRIALERLAEDQESELFSSERPRGVIQS